MLNKIVVEFVPRLGEATQLPSFSLTLSKRMTYDQFAAKVGEHLNVEPSHLRFTTVNTAGKPKAAVKYSLQGTLNNILFPGPYTYGGGSMQKSDALFYEVLEMSLREMEQRRPQKVVWLPEGINKEVSLLA